MASSPITSENMPLGKREFIVLLAALMSLNGLAIDIMLPAIDEMARDLGAEAGNQRQLVIALYSMGMGFGCLIPGSFADRFGRRPILLFSLCCFTVLSLITAFLESFQSLLIIRTAAGILGAGLMVVPMAMVRDLYEGDRMARLMSIVGAVFITVPVFAPSLGQAILLFGGWRWIFILLAASGALATLWVVRRVPETLREDRKQAVNIPVIAGNMKMALFTRSSIGYVLGSMLVMGPVFGYVNSAQQMFGEHFGIGEAVFPILFGGTAAMMAFANIINSRIVVRFGARRVSHAGVLGFIFVSLLQVAAAHYRPGEILFFLPLTAINLGLLGFLAANFGSIAMQPFSHIAGSASSVQTFLRMLGAASVGAVIGQVFDGTARPFADALLICSVTALLLVLYSEKGRLFRRINPPTMRRERMVP